MMQPKLDRYPGVAPFSTDQQDVFFGRQDDIERLHDLVITEQQVLLYANSGLGKSSLLNAGVVPLLSANPKRTCIMVRFGAYQEGQTTTLVETILASFDFPTENLLIDKIIPQQNSLWYRFKKLQLQHPDHEYILVFDQFEELFSYPEEDIFQFKKQIADLLHSIVPKNFRKVLQIKQRKNPDFLTLKELQQLNQPQHIKLLLAIREDRYSQLHQLTDFLPRLTHNRYHLAPLQKAQARQAIVTPAKLADNNRYKTPPFVYSPDALAKILAYLTQNNTQPVETTQLQILCNRLEKLQLPVVQVADIPNFQDIFLNFYYGSIQKLPSKHHLSVQRFIETDLIKKGQRISLDSLICFDVLPKTIFDQLVDEHLLRAVRNNTDGISYELSHDTLIAPIQQAREKREVTEQQQRETEERKRLEQQLAKEQAERLEQERRTAKQTQLRTLAEEGQQRADKEKKRARWLAFAAIGIAAIALVIAYFAYTFYQDAQNRLAEIEKQNAIREARELKAFGDNYNDLGKPTYACRSYQNALKALDDYPKEPLYIELTKFIESCD